MNQAQQRFLMEYVEVESSQIAEVGFGEGYYGPETLGLRFPPTKKQVAAGEDGSEYHYQNVTPRMHQALMASIGSYFGQNIKSRPDLYPFMKVEAENPPQPPVKFKRRGSTINEELDDFWEDEYNNHRGDDD